MTKTAPHILCIAALLLTSCQRGGPGIFDSPVFADENGEELYPRDFPLNARPQVTTDLVTLADVYEGIPLRWRTWADRSGAYLLYQAEPGLDENLLPTERGPVQFITVSDLGGSPRILPTPSFEGGDGVGDYLDGDCDIVPTIEPGLIAMQCFGKIGRLLPGADAWTYTDEPADYAGAPILVAGRDAVLYAPRPYPVYAGGGKIVDTSVAPDAIAAGQPARHWIGPWDGARVRVFYVDDPLELCTAIWDLESDSVEQGDCLSFQTPGAGLLSPEHVAGSVERTIFMGGGETNGPDMGDQFLASTNGASIEILGRLSDRGNTPLSQLTPAADYLPQHTETYATAPLTFRIQNGPNLRDTRIREEFTATGEWSFRRISETDEMGGFVLDRMPTCPMGERLKECRAIPEPPNNRVFAVDQETYWMSSMLVHDARRRVVFAKRVQDNDVVTTIDPMRIIDAYVPLEPEAGGAPVYADGAPGYAPTDHPRFVSLSECATVFTSDGAEVTLDATGRFDIAFDDDHRIVLDGCDPGDGYLPLLGLEADAPNAALGQLPDAWFMNGVEFARGLPLFVEDATPEVVVGRGRMLVRTADGWTHIAAPGFGSDLETTIVAPAGASAPAFIGTSQLVARADGSVFDPAQDMVVGTLEGVDTPASLTHTAFGAIVLHDGDMRASAWRITGDSITRIHDEVGPHPQRLLDVSDDGQRILEFDGQTLSVREPGAGRSVDLVTLTRPLIEAHITADGQRVAVFEGESVTYTATLYQLHTPTATSWSVYSELQREGSRFPFAFQRATGRTLMPSSDPPGAPDYRKLVMRTPGDLTPSTASVVSDDPGNQPVVLDGPDHVVVGLQRIAWANGMATSLTYSAEPPTPNVPERYHSVFDTVIAAYADRRWYLRVDGVLEPQATVPLANLRGAEVGPGNDFLYGRSLRLGQIGLDGALATSAYPVVLVRETADDALLANRLFFSGAPDDGAFVEAPCVLYSTTPVPAYVTSPWPTWVCSR